MGHALGLWHIALYDPKDYILGSGKKLSFHEARWLSKSYYFNDNWHFSFAPEIVKLEDMFAVDDDTIRLTMSISDPNGLHQAYIFQNTNILGWDFLEGENDITNFDIKREHLSENDNKIWIQLMDNHGNWLWYPRKYELPDKLPEPKPEPQEVIYEDYIKRSIQSWNFENHAKGWEIANGNWSIDNGLYKVSRGGRTEHSLVGQLDWENYIINVKVRIDNVHFAGVVFRAKSEKEYYVYSLNTLDQKNQLFKHKAGAWDNREEIAWTFTVGEIRLENNVWYNLTVKVLKDKFICYINGKKQIETLHNDYKVGKVGVWTWETAASFDDFIISKIDIDDSFAVDPIGKLTTLWSHIKQID